MPRATALLLALGLAACSTRREAPPAAEARPEAAEAPAPADALTLLVLPVERVEVMYERFLPLTHFLQRFNEENRKLITGVDPAVMEAFLEHRWPGNVRELENAVERAVVLCTADTITLQHLPRSLRERPGAPPPGAPLAHAPPRAEGSLGLFENERRLLLEALERTGWNQTRTAEVLGISRKQLRTRMKNHDLLR